MRQQALGEVEQALLAAYERQFELYSDLLEFSKGVSPEVFAGGMAEESLHRMGQVMATIARMDEQSGPLRESWRASGGKATGRLAEVMRGIEEMILALMAFFERAESEALEAKERLTPQLSAEARRRKMASAYQAARVQS